MQFPELPVKQGDSHLFVTFSGGCASFLLVSADYQQVLTSVDTFVAPLSRAFGADQADLFLAKSLTAWSADIGVDLVGCEDDLCMMSLSEEGRVGGATLLVSPEYVAEPFHSVVLGVESQVYDEKTHIDAAVKYFDAYGFSRLIYVVLDWDTIRVLILTTGRVHSHREGKTIVREMHISGEFLDKIPETMVPSLLSTRMRKDVLIDALSNVRDRKVTAVGSDDVRDVLRGYVTGALFGMKDPEFQVFGSKSDHGLIVTGDIARVLPEKNTILSVIDGLQLRGRYSIFVDREQRGVPAVVASESGAFIFPLPDIYPRRYEYISTQKGGSGKNGQTAFRGRIRQQGCVDDRDDIIIVGQTGHVYSFSVQGAGNVLLQPSKSVYFPAMEKVMMGEDVYVTTEYSSQSASVIVDCRTIPVVYGPDALANHQRISEWLRGFPGEQ